MFERVPVSVNRNGRQHLGNTDRARHGETPATIATFRPVPPKFIRITQTGTPQNGELWAIQQVRIDQTRGAGATR